MEKPTAFFPPAGMWIRISVFVAFPPTPFATPCLLPACSAARTPPGRMFPFQSLRLSSPISRMFCAPVEEPLVIASEPPMPPTSRTTKYDKPLTMRTSAAAAQDRTYPVLPALPRSAVPVPALPIASPPGSWLAVLAAKTTCAPRDQAVTASIGEQMTEPRRRDADPRPPHGGVPGPYRGPHPRPRGRDPGARGETHRRGSPPGRTPRRWGALPGRSGVCIVIGGAALGAAATAATGSEPGFVLGLLVVAGTAAAAPALPPPAPPPPHPAPRPPAPAPSTGSSRYQRSPMWQPP